MKETASASLLMRGGGRSVLGMLLLALTCPHVHARGRADWMHEARWGVMTHYLTDWIAREHNIEMGATKWNELVDGFDVEGLADQIESTGAGYLILTIGQNSGYFASPSAAYDRLTGIHPSKCSERDLMLDMAKALQRRDIRLIAYLPAGAPGRDQDAVRALDYQRGANRNGRQNRDAVHGAVEGDWTSHRGQAVFAATTTKEPGELEELPAC